LAAGAESGRGGEQRERGDDAAEDRAWCGGSGRVGRGRGGEEDRADEIGEARRPRVLERPLAEARLDELEVCEAGEAEPPSEGQADDELRREDPEQPPRAGRDGERREGADRRLVESRRPRVDDVEVAVRVG